MGLATDILDFFNIIDVPQRPTGVRSVVECIAYLQKKDNSLHLGQIMGTIEKLKSRGLLLDIKQVIDSKKFGANGMEELLVSSGYSRKFAEYGMFDFIVEGFLSIVNKFSKSVRPVVVEDKKEDPGIGTAFLIASQNIMISARHVVEDMKWISIPDSNDTPLRVKRIGFPIDDKLDIAIIELEEEISDAPGFAFGEGVVLGEVLTIGYPPIPGFQAMQLYEVASVNNSFKVSKGRIVGVNEKYNHEVEYLIINAKVKGGNSGSPVIDENGFVIGMVMEIPLNSQDTTKLDSLGYGVVTPSSVIVECVNGMNTGEKMVIYNVENVDQGFRITSQL